MWRQQCSEKQGIRKPHWLLTVCILFICCLCKEVNTPEKKGDYIRSYKQLIRLPFVSWKFFLEYHVHSKASMNCRDTQQQSVLGTENYSLFVNSVSGHFCLCKNKHGGIFCRRNHVKAATAMLWWQNQDMILLLTDAGGSVSSSLP